MTQRSLAAEMLEKGALMVDFDALEGQAEKLSNDDGGKVVPDQPAT